MKSQGTFLFGATSIVGWNILRTSQEGIIPFCNTHNRLKECKSWRRLNLENKNEVQRILQSDPPKRVIHCGGICDVEKCEKNPDWAREININSISNLLDFISNETKLIYCSSDHVFGHDGIYSETSTPCPISVYGYSKFAAEKLIQKRKPDALVLRFGLPIGPSIDKRSGHLDWLQYRSKKGLPITIVRGEERSAVNTEDLCKRILKLSASSLNGIRHIPATRRVSRPDLAKYLMRKRGIQPTFSTQDRKNQKHPHLGAIELKTNFKDNLSAPLPSVLDQFI